MNRSAWIAAGLVLAAAGCKQSQPTRLYEAVPVERRDLDVRISAAGLIEPVLTVDVKSKASGEIIAMRVETGSEVKAGQLMARIDPRLQQTALAQADANLEVARAQLQNAEAQKRRAEELYKQQGIAETEFEVANLNYATARAQVVRAEADVASAHDGMEDTSIKAPISGTILEKNAELGTVISSPTKDVGGGTLLFKMANLDTMQVRALVDETDIGKVATDAQASVNVEAYPNRSFDGRVLKIEPQAVVQQNVTMFPVLIGIDNPGHLLRPGMNTEVEIEVGRRDHVLTIPNAALRTQRDVASAAQVLGLDPATVQEELAQAQAQAESSSSVASQDRRTASLAGGAPTSGPQKMTLPNGREITLPDGVTPDQVRAIMQKRMSGAEISPAERALMGRVFASGGGGGGSGRGARAATRAGAFGGRAIVFELRNGTPRPVEIQTGLTDFDHIEVTQGLAEGDTVLLLPSASLIASQQQFRERVQRIQGGSGLPGMQQQQRPQAGSSAQQQGTGGRGGQSR